MDTGDLLLTKPSDMMMGLYTRSIHPEFFRIFASRSYKAPEYEAQLWITGLSHVLMVTRTGSLGAKEACITEIIGPADVDLPQRGLVETLPLKGNDESRFELRNGFRYHIGFETETFSDDDLFATVYDDLRNQGATEGLSCEYRLEGVQRRLWPLAMTMPSHARGGFLLHAFHVFPDHRTILKTQTLVEVPQKGRSRRR